MNSNGVIVGLFVALIGIGIVRSLVRSPVAEAAQAIEPLPAPKGEPDLAPYMQDFQRHSQKLGYAIGAKNEKLTGFYLEELVEVTDRLIADAPIEDGLALGEMAGTIMTPELRALAASIDQRDWKRTESAYRGIIDRLVHAGAEAIILGCTEIAMLIGAEDSPVPLFDTTALHARAAAEWATAST